jgi:predicted PurR-regulated permease PerM
MHSSSDLARTTLAVIFIGALLFASLWILSPFLPAMIWGGMIVVATWPAMQFLQARLWGRRCLAVAAMSAMLLLLLVVPISLAIATIVENVDRIAALSRAMVDFTLPMPPEWVERLPLVGARLHAAWRDFAALHPDELTVRLAPHIGSFIGWFAAEAGGVGMVLVHFLLTLTVAIFLYLKGDGISAGMLRFARRLAGDRGESVSLLAVRAIRAVFLGVVVTAFLQSALAGIGLATVGVPYAGMLTAVIFVLGVAQVGALPVLLPAVVWLYWKGDPWWGTLLLAWTLFLAILDSLLRPVLIRRGANLSLLLIFAGVIGGLIAFGVIGLFIGPVVLAVSFTLLSAWTEEGGGRDRAAAGGASTSDA